ncbi:MAG: hypothetical protein M1821_008682 [Bathelium mastoideum]|nr:MAG: hypothetical protein M1821_008682 [Bathelium mastoideum]
MAENKRGSTAGKVATPKIAPQLAMQELDAALAKAIGARVKITTTIPNNTLQGTLFAACPITNLIVLNTTPPPPNPSSTLASQPCEYHTIHISKIQSYQIQSLPNDSPRSDSASENGLFSMAKLDFKALKSREQATIRKIKERDTMKGKGVSKEAQEIFDAMARTLPARWHETSMIINDVVRIDSPYRVEDCKAPQEQAHALERVKKVLDNERRKIGEKAGRASGVATPVGMRKGG